MINLKQGSLAWVLKVKMLMKEAGLPAPFPNQIVL